MLVDGEPYRTIWTEPDDPGAVRVIDQRRLPFAFEILRVDDVSTMVWAIADMAVRGAPLIGAAAAHGMALAAAECLTVDAAAAQRRLALAADQLRASRPTAVNLAWAVDRVAAACAGLDGSALSAAAWAEAAAIADEDAEMCAAIGRHGVELLEEIHERTGEPVRVLTHCNAGWLATVDHGTATAPIYEAHDRGVPVEVWVDETRPRNQGARLTAWELGHQGIPHRLVVDNAGGHLMQQGLVDLVLVGSDRTTATGDVANKIGTYLKALAADDNGVPFHVALPSSTIDWELEHGADIPIEERAGREVTHILGDAGGEVTEVALAPAATEAANPAFDVTPARLVTGLITERGRCAATPEGIAALFPERSP